MIPNNDYFECACGNQVDCSSDDIIRTHIKSCPRYVETSSFAKIFKNMNMDFISTEDLKVIAVELIALSDDIKGKIKSRGGNLRLYQMSHPIFFLQKTGMVSMMK